MKILLISGHGAGFLAAGAAFDPRCCRCCEDEAFESLSLHDDDRVDVLIRLSFGGSRRLFARDPSFAPGRAMRQRRTGTESGWRISGWRDLS